MSEPFEHALSNGRRGRHAAPSESRRPDYLSGLDQLGEYPAHPADPTPNGDRPHANGTSEDRYPDGPAHPTHPAHPVNGSGGHSAGSATYPGYGLPAEWAKPVPLSPASTQPSLTRPDWDEPASPPAASATPPAPAAPVAPAAPAGEDPGWQSPATQPDWRAPMLEPTGPTEAEPAGPTWGGSDEPPRTSTSTELAVPDYGWASPAGGSHRRAGGTQHRAEPADGDQSTPTAGTAAGRSRDRHAALEPPAWGGYGEPARPGGPPTGPEPAVRPGRHGADRTDRTDHADHVDRVDIGNQAAPALRSDPPYRSDPAPVYRSESDRPAGGDAGGNLPARLDPAGPRAAGSDPAGAERRARLARLADAVGDLADGCRALAGDLYAVGGARHGGADTAQTAVQAARLLDRAADGADGVRDLLEAARRALAASTERSADARPAGADTAERAAVRHSFEHLVVGESAGRNGSTPHDRVPPTIPQPREATMPPEFPSTAPSYPPVLPLGLRDGAQAASVARQVEAARRHLMAALTVGHDVNDPAWRQQLLGMVEQVLAAVAEVATLARDALAPSAADTTFPGEARFLCALPWEHVPVASPERSDLPATVGGVAVLLTALGYEARATRTEQGTLQVEVRGTRYAARVVLQQLRLSGTGEWMAYLDWTDGSGHPRSGAETLGPAELSDDELARRVDDSLRRRVGPQSG